MKITLVFEPDRPTKNTWLFKEQPQNGLDEAMGSAYLKKWVLQAAGIDVPGPITVTIDLKPEDVTATPEATP